MQLALKHPWILLVMLALVLAEAAWRRAKGRGYDSGSALASLGVALGQAVFRPLSGVVIAAAMLGLSRLSPWQFPASDGRTWVAGFFAVEFAYYWFHRLSHTVRWLWATHAVHHSSPEYILPSAIRLGWTELFSLGWVFFAALVLIGFPPLVVGTLLGVNLLYQFPLHTESVRSLGPLEWVLNSPAHHRAHHSSDAEYLDCNFGGVLIVWDRLFGTFRSAPAGLRLTYGLVHKLETRNPIRIALAEWRRLFADLTAAHGPRAKLRIALGRP